MRDAFLGNSCRIYQRFVAQLLDLEKQGDADSLLSYIQMAAKFAWLVPTGRYADGQLENRALEIGLATKNFLNESPSKSYLNLPTKETRRKVLHLATCVQSVGGHTKLIANWISNDPGSCHSLLITGGSSSQREEDIPLWLREAVSDNGGCLVVLPSTGLLSKALSLRTIVQRDVDMVVMHHHPDDVVPVVAFATDRCPPVAILNQAHHVFWLGPSISDAVIEIWPSGRPLSETRRFVKHSLFLPIPLSASPQVSRANARRALQIPDDQVAMLSIGSAFKYTPTDTHDFYRVAIILLERHPHVHLYLIGVTWDDCAEYLNHRQHDRLHLLGIIEEPSLYRAAADIYLEGFPLCSETALLESTLSGACPVLSFAPGSRLLTCDDVALSGVIENATGEEEYIEKVSYLIRNRQERERVSNQAKARVSTYHGGPEWTRSLQSVYGYLDRTKHCPNSIPNTTFLETDDDVSLSRVSARLYDPEDLWSEMSRLARVREEITALIGPKDTFILVDQDEWGTEETIRSRHPLPFLERGGEYWGVPPDEATAVQELERLRSAGANFMVFGWPAFWWLDYYTGLHRHLRSNYRCVLQTELLIVFDLRSSGGRIWSPEARRAGT
jgi:glycosyltransferase involved in cell wall biosynthesis